MESATADEYVAKSARLERPNIGPCNVGEPRTKPLEQKTDVPGWMLT
jgi:hypothetical protein